MNATETLAAYVAQTRLEDLPPDVLATAKLCILDAAGCALGGVETAIGRSVIDALCLGGGTATVIGTDERAAPWDAAFINATLANALDFDDGNGAGHPSATIMPAVLAAAEHAAADGAGMLLAFALGHEVSTRVGRAMRPTRERRDVAWGIGTHQSFGAAAAAAKIFNLDRLGVMNAFGIAGAGSPVPSAAHWGWKIRPLTWVKDAVAWPAHAGVVAAQLARKGFSGCKDILDGPTGFWAMAGSDQCDYAKMTGELGTRFYTREATFKPYASCRYTHAPLDAVHELLNERDIDERAIESIDVFSISDLSKMFMDFAPDGMVDAQFSLPYAIAMVVGRRPAGPAWFDPAVMNDPLTRATMAKVTITIDPYAEDQFFNSSPAKFVATVKIAMQDGMVYQKTVEYPRGQPENPLPPGFLHEKFLHLATPRLGRDRAAELKDRILNLEDEPGIGRIAALMRPAAISVHGAKDSALLQTA